MIKKWLTARLLECASLCTEFTMSSFSWFSCKHHKHLTLVTYLSTHIKFMHFYDINSQMFIIPEFFTRENCPISFKMGGIWQTKEWGFLKSNVTQLKPNSITIAWKYVLIPFITRSGVISVIWQNGLGLFQKSCVVVKGGTTHCMGGGSNIIYTPVIHNQYCTYIFVVGYKEWGAKKPTYHSGIALINKKSKTISTFTS